MVRPEGVMSMKNSSDTIGNRTRAVPQPTALLRAPHGLGNIQIEILEFSFRYFLYISRRLLVSCSLVDITRAYLLCNVFAVVKLFIGE